MSLLFLCLLVAEAQEGPPLLLGKGYQSRLDLTTQLNDSGRYIEAYDSARVLHRDIKLALEQQGLTAATMPNPKDFILYQNVLISEAEYAYMVNLGNEMERIAREHSKAIEEREAKGLGQYSDYHWQVASLFKVKGDYKYLKGAKDPVWYAEAREDYQVALYYYEMASDWQARTMVLAEMAQLEYAQGNYAEALKYINQALGGNKNRRTAKRQAKGESESLNISYQSALAMCQAHIYKFDEALNTIEAAMARLPENDKRLPELMRRKAKILMMRHEEYGTDYKDASELYETYFKSIKNSVNDNFMQMSAVQREEYWMQQRPFVTDCYQLEERNPELLYDVTLYNKGMLLQMARSFEDLLYDGTGKGRGDERGLLKELREQDVRNQMYGEKTTLAEDYEKRLLKTMNADGRRQRFFAPLSHNWKDVQKALPTEGCAIEFVEYEKQDEMHFGALVLKNTGSPMFIHICNAEELAEYYPGGGLMSLETLLEFTDGTIKNELYEDEVIRDSIWTNKLIAAIGNSRKIYFSTDGYLHQLAIEYMLPEALRDKKLYRLTSTRVLAEGQKANEERIKKGAALVIGGIEYDSYKDRGETLLTGNDAIAYRTFQARGSTFGNMKGAKLECDSIIHYRNNPRDLYLDSLKATEQAFNKHCSQFPILHLSTHGCFNGDMSIQHRLLASSSSRDVLSECVLALSNANRNLHDKTFDAFNLDGLLSAREIARLNLENVELVTTSACQTGLGYITADGIYGIQRGFKSAGAKGMIMTLWSVDVESARIFFTSFYRYMSEGESVHSAFGHARQDLLTQTYTTTTLVSKFKGSTLSRKETQITTTTTYDKPQHSCPYLLIDVWD